MNEMRKLMESVGRLNEEYVEYRDPDGEFMVIYSFPRGYVAVSKNDSAADISGESFDNLDDAIEHAEISLSFGDGSDDGYDETNLQAFDRDMSDSEPFGDEYDESIEMIGEEPLREYREDDLSEIADELEEIQGQMMDLIHQADSLLRGTDEYNAAKGYWIAHITTALSSDHDYLGGSMSTMQDTIDALREGDVDADDDGYDEDGYDKDGDHRDDKFDDPNPRGADESIEEDDRGWNTPKEIGRAHV